MFARPLAVWPALKAQSARQSAQIFVTTCNPSKMKTAVTVLQEMMIKKGRVPEYECVSQTGPQHQSLFRYNCKACGETATATARSKKEAKQEVARVMLQQLSAAGHSVPPPYGTPGNIPTFPDLEDGGAGAGVDVRSYVALLRELCVEFRLAAATYELVGDTGPPHLRHFTVRAALGHHTRLATATTKRQARQRAAEQLYSYLREYLARLTKDFNEEEALARINDKPPLERSPELSDEILRRPDLGQRISEYHLGLTTRLEPETARDVAELLATSRPRWSQSPERVVTAAASRLRLEMAWSELPAVRGAGMAILELAATSPELVFAAASRNEAAARALAYIDDSFRDLELPPSPPAGPGAPLPMSTMETIENL